MSIVITGASGNLGHRVAELVLDQVDPATVRLVTRSPDKVRDLTDRGASVVQADFDAPATLIDALAGATRVLLISTDALGARVEQHRNVVDAAKAAGVELLAYTSVPKPVADNPVFVVPDHLATEALVRDSGVPSTFLRNGFYADMQVAAAANAIASGRLVSNEGDGRAAYAAREDCAAAAAAVLVGGDHAGAVYDITGPAPVTAVERAALFADLGGRPVEVVQVDDAAYAAGLEQAGVPADLAPAFATVGAATRGGFFDVESDDVETLLGRPPLSLRDVLEQHRAELTPAA